MIDCKHIDELLVEYLYQELEPSQVERFEAHLQSCPRCAQELGSYERTRAIVQELPELEPPARIDERILAQAERAVQARPAGVSEEPGFWQKIVEGLRLLVMHPAMTAAVTLVLVLGVSFYVYRSSSPKSAREELDAPYTPEVDRRLPGGSATISVRERVADESQLGSQQQKAKEEQAPAPAARRQEPRLAKEEPTEARRPQLKVARRAKTVASEEERGRTAAGRSAGNLSANALGQGGAAGGSPATATPAAEPVGKDQFLKVAKAPKADEAPSRASKSRDREVDKNEGFAQKKIVGDSLDGALGKGGKLAPAKSSGARLVAKAPPRKEAPRAKPTPVAVQARVGKGKGWSGKGSSMTDDLDSLGAEGKAAYKGQLASKTKAPPSALAASEAERGDKARASGRCDQALAYYNRAISLDQKQLPALAGKVRACAAMLGRVSDLPLAKATKIYPALAGLLVPELEKARRARAERAATETQQVRGPRKAKAKAAAPAKSDALK